MASEEMFSCGVPGVGKLPHGSLLEVVLSWLSVASHVFLALGVSHGGHNFNNNKKTTSHRMQAGQTIEATQ